MSEQNPFEGTPLGGSPHWFARDPATRAHPLHDLTLGAAAATLIGGALAYHQTGDRNKAVRAAGANLACFLALGPCILAWGFSTFFCLLALVAGDFGFAAVLALVAIGSMVGFLAVIKHFTHRLGRIVAPPFPPSIPR